jgi:SAM-dependent methyltransferase
MASYKQFARFYDIVMGNRSKEGEIVQELILEYRPQARNVLEIACGTGAILKTLPKKYHLYGLDISQDMLALAKKKVPRAKFFRQDMRHFEIAERFDVILCLFDSINHLLDYKDWEKVFSKVKKHLNKGGIFIFDINSAHKLKNLSQAPAIVKKIKDNYLIMDISGIKRDLFNWDVKVFEKEKANNYKLYKENIKEKSYPVEKIMKTLKKNYSKIKTFDQKKKKPSKDSRRIYFVASVA